MSAKEIKETWVESGFLASLFARTALTDQRIIELNARICLISRVIRKPYAKVAKYIVGFEVKKLEGAEAKRKRDIELATASAAYIRHKSNWH